MDRGEILSKSSELRSLDDLHRQYRAPLLSFFSRRVRDPSVTEDLAQQVFERLVRRGDLTTIDNLGAYIFQTARSIIVDHLRKNGDSNNATELFEAGRHGDVDFSPEHVLVKKHRLARVLEILDRLPERTRKIFVMRRIEGMKFRDIGEHFGISVSAVEKHMERAIARLLEDMDEGRP